MQTEFLTETEMFFIKKYASGVIVNQTKNDLYLKNPEAFFKNKEVIKSKLGITSDLDLIEKAFYMGLLVVDDFILKNINHIAFGIAYNIYVDNKNNKILENLYTLYTKVFDIYLSIIKTHTI